MVKISQESIEILAYKLYKLNEPYENMIWRLAELCETLKRTLASADCSVETIEALELANVVRDKIKTLKIIYPTEAEIRPAADALYHQQPERSKLHWFIAEKTLLLQKLIEIYGDGKEQK